MKKRVLMLFALLLAVSGLEAQTFIVANGDGVDIKYTALDESTARIEPYDYSGRVVVPTTVTYEGVTYTVTSVANSAFANTDVTYVELPSTLSNMGVMLFAGSQLDTLRLNYPGLPVNNFGNPLSENVIKALFGNNKYETVHVIVPQGALAMYRDNGWGILPLLDAPGAVPVTLYAPKRCQLSVGSQFVKAHNTPAMYFTRYYEIGDKVWMAAYPDGVDSLFLGWDKGDVYLTEIVQADTLRPVFKPVGYAQLSVNNVSTPVKFTGQMSYQNGVANYYVPADGTVSPLFSNGLWMAGTDTSEWEWAMYSRALTYNCAGDYVPGPLRVGGTLGSDLETRKAFNRVWSVSRAEIDDFIAHVGSEGYSIPENILTWPGNGGEGYAEQLAPYYDADSDGYYDPHHGDYPLIRGDRMAFSIFNDVTVAYNTGSAPLGMEVHMSAYAFDEPEDTVLNNTVFVSYKIINRSNREYYDAYLGAFTDFDIGYGYNDYIGCDVRSGMAYGYNGTATDQDYTGVPPAQGCIMLAGPYDEADAKDNPRVDIVKMEQYYPEALATYQLSEGGYDTVRLNGDADLYYPQAWAFVGGYDVTSGYFNTRNASINGMNYGNGIADDERLGMCKFVYYENSTNAINGDPLKAFDYWNYLRGAWKNYQEMKFGGNAFSWGASDLNCSFMFPGDSDPLHWGTGGYVPDEEYYPNDWTEITAGNSPGDRRGVQSSGPFTFEAGEVNTLDLAYTTAFGSTDAASSLTKLREQALEVRRQFERDTTDSGRPFTYMPYSAPIVGMESAPTQPSLRVYPNPTRDRVTVALGEGRQSVIEVYDMRGNKVLTRTQCTGLVQLDVASLAQGVYIIRCGSAVSRFVKL